VCFVLDYTNKREESDEGGVVVHRLNIHTLQFSMKQMWSVALAYDQALLTPRMGEKRKEAISLSANSYKAFPAVVRPL